MYGHPSLLDQHAAALAPACFVVSVTEMQRVVRACRILAVLRRRAESSPVLVRWGVFQLAGGGRFSSCSASTTATNSQKWD